MGIPDSSLLDLVVKIRSWVSWRGSDLQCLSDQFDMLKSSYQMCCNCHRNNNEMFLKYNCKSCGRWLCGKCIEGCDLDNLESEGSALRKTISSCKFCSDVNETYSDTQESPRQSLEPLSPCFSIESERSCSSLNSESSKSYLQAQDYAYAPQVMSIGSMALSGSPPPQVTAHPSARRNDENGIADSEKHLYSPSSTYCHIRSGTYSSNVSASHETYNYKSKEPNSIESPSRTGFAYSRVGLPVQWGQGRSPISQYSGSFGQQAMEPDQGTEDAYNTDYFSDDLSIFWSQNENSHRPLDFQNNDPIWFPPSPDDNMIDDTEGSIFAFDDEDDDIGDSGALFSSSSSLSTMFPAKEKHSAENKEPLKAVIQGHYRALVSQLLQGEGIEVSKESSSNDWLEIVATIAWQAANFVRPDTSKGGSMDPGDYVKVKCIASGSPSESTFVKGVVCTKSIKHKRMTSQYKRPRILLLAGALEYQKAPNQLASFNTLLQQENHHMKMIISKIEALQPNVLLVEKTVASCAQEYLLAKEISLVLNVKRSLLERIARCSGALIAPSIDYLSTARLGHCELFKLNRMVEDHETSNQFNKKPSKTLMFFEGCPRRLGCTVLLKGACREELKKIKHVVQYAVFAAYHLSLETSFLADEGATLPKMRSKNFVALTERVSADNDISILSNSQSEADNMDSMKELTVLESEIEGLGSEPEHLDGLSSPSHASTIGYSVGKVLSNAGHDDLIGNLAVESGCLNPSNESEGGPILPSCRRDWLQLNMHKSVVQEGRQHGEITQLTKDENDKKYENDENEFSAKYFSAADGNQSILVYFTSHCVSKGMVCEHAKLLRIKFYGSDDKPLGRYLRENLFDQTSHCQSCKERMEAHVLCFMHQQGNLTIKVKHLSSAKLPGERDGKIWMWHRCLRCPHVNGVPPATPRVVMSDAAWGLSFGKFLELSFSDHATANRVATCGHSLQRHCLRFYGVGSMVAFFQYSPSYILSVHLPPSVLEFGHMQEEWIRKEARELLGKTETLYGEISYLLECMEKRISLGVGYELCNTCDIHNHVAELKDMIKKERDEYHSLLVSETTETSQPRKMALDILELNRLRRSLLIGSHVWDHRLCYLDSLIKKISGSKFKQENDESFVELFRKDHSCDHWPEQSSPWPSNLQEHPESCILKQMDECLEPCSEACTSNKNRENLLLDIEFVVNKTSFDCFPAQESNLSERIDSAWTGADQSPSKVEPLHAFQADDLQAGCARRSNLNDTHPFRRLIQPVRVHSFDSALRVRERSRQALPPSLQFSTVRSFHAYGDYMNMVRDPVSNPLQAHFQLSPWEVQKLNLMLNARPLFISAASHVAEGVRLLLPQTRHGHRVIAVYDDDYSSIISYALSSKEYEDGVVHKLDPRDGSLVMHERSKQHSASSSCSSHQSVGLSDLEYIHYGGYRSEDAPSSVASLLMDSKKSLHLRISFGDDSMGAGGKVNFSVTCYYAKQFDLLRKLCFPDEVDFIRSLSRCHRWNAQGGKSNVYFAKSLDDRFIIKQVKKTELDSFEEFAPQYFTYLMDSLKSGSPTCLAKILGIYQVIVKYPKGGKETKIDLMLMENIFYKRNISRVYDLKGSKRSRYNSETSGTMLDLNLLEALRTKPIFLGSMAKRRLERAVWNDTAFLGSVDVMDYSLLVGVDDERKELVLGIIDFMRQYTWDKHLETWVKASGIFGGPKDDSPTVVSPKLYKKRFRKAMTAYFLTLPDQLSSSG
ncbi:putative 1-phosphatidylinositol-3-phosphate 5-kinase FAB1C [Neltuma alba]|uniref:putative 1-phosphatidylinositol-3-phosphate 5-kinase FAB1C n=1 Tax=Neltuma alba TaxID=207710 RepID=UPI0010A44820|nr:putative 1-phosphatidylinositol-3-phosphate 5-kinase FAB1C [Prosopis alba]XP_028759082.1 putative 1-phosphatidylinositol-3-phosphate 5-kinase FAB1C [Prosopis alba]